jgi:predicted metal-dependent hydrolase
MIDWLKRDPRKELSIELEGMHLPIILRRHATAKRMTMRLSADGKQVRITLPQWGRTAEAIAFAQSRRDWLARQMAASPAPQQVGQGATILFRGEVVTIHHDAAAPRRAALNAAAVTLGGPQASLEARVRRWLEGEARSHMAADLAEYCRKAGRDSPRLGLSKARRRWGSCAPDGTIRLNWRLIMAPDFVRRSVVAHEVAHLIHFDHSPRFHAFLAELFEGEIETANQWLRREGQNLYRVFP